jgi:flavin reductase (DIM6/NTAB) family NADH-FMN oxidoreductase RutF
MDSHTAPALDISAFRKAMGSFPTGVTVVTVASGDGSMRHPRRPARTGLMTYTGPGW